MKQFLFPFFLLWLSVFSRADVLTKEVLNKIVGNTAVSHLQESNRVNASAVQSVSIASVKLTNGKDSLYNANVFISEAACEIIFVFDLRISKVKDGWQASVIGETSYHREWRKKFLFSYRGRSELSFLDTNDKDFSKWVDPDTNTIKTMFFNLLKQDFKLDSADLQNFKFAKQRICQKYVFLMNEKVFVCNGRLVSLGAKEATAKITGGKKKRSSYGAILFMYKTPAGVWSADLLDQKIKVSIMDDMDI